MTSGPSIFELQAEISSLQNKSEDALSITFSEIEVLKEKNQISNEKVVALQHKLSTLTENGAKIKPAGQTDIHVKCHNYKDEESKEATRTRGNKGPTCGKQRSSKPKFLFRHSVHVCNESQVSNDKNQLLQKFHTMKNLAEAYAETAKKEVTGKNIFRRHSIFGFDDLQIKEDKKMTETELIKMIATAVEKNKKMVQSLNDDLNWKDITHFLLEKQKCEQQNKIDSLQLEICEIHDIQDDMAYYENTKAVALVVIKQIKQKRNILEVELEGSKQQAAKLKMLLNRKIKEDLKRYGEGYEKDSFSLLNEIRRENFTRTRYLNKVNAISNGSYNFLKSCCSGFLNDKKDIAMKMKLHLSKLREMVTQVDKTVKSNDGACFPRNEAYPQIQSMDDALKPFESVSESESGQYDERKQLTKSWTSKLHMLIERQEYEDLMDMKGMQLRLQSKHKQIATLMKKSSGLETLITSMQPELMKCLTETKKGALARIEMMSKMEKRVAEFKKAICWKAKKMNRKEMALKRKLNLV